MVLGSASPKKKDRKPSSFKYDNEETFLSKPGLGNSFEREELKLKKIVDEMVNE